MGAGVRSDSGTARSIKGIAPPPHDPQRTHLRDGIHEPAAREVHVDDKVRRYLKKINPTLTDDDFIDLRASRYRYAQPICDPGYLDKLPPVALPVKGLWVADTSYYYPEDRGISESIGFGRRIAKQVVE